MTNIAGYDVFNGDADGICALIQLRMVEPRDSYLITSVKRNIELLKNVQAGVGDRVTVLDVSMDKNHRPCAGNFLLVAAGINDLALELLDDFVSKFERTYE